MPTMDEALEGAKRGATLIKEAGTTMEATPQEHDKVARDECRTHGHTYDVIGVMQGWPVKLLCTVCGSTWRLHPDDQKKLWGTE